MSSQPPLSQPPAHARGDSGRFTVKTESYHQPEESHTSRGHLSREKLHIPLPPLPESFPELSKLSAAQLKRFLSDDAAVNVSRLTPLPSVPYFLDRLTLGSWIVLRA